MTFAQRKAWARRSARLAADSGADADSDDAMSKRVAVVLVRAAGVASAPPAPPAARDPNAPVLTREEADGLLRETLAAVLESHARDAARRGDYAAAQALANRIRDQYPTAAPRAPCAKRPTSAWRLNMTRPRKGTNMTSRKQSRKSRIDKPWGAKPRLIRVALACALALAATGCFWDMISWSQDGRYVAFFNPGDDDGNNPDAGVLWRWDVSQERAEKLELRDDATPDIVDRTLHGAVQGCRYMPDGKHMAVLVMPPGEKTSDGNLDLWLRDANGPASVKVASGVGMTFDVGPNGTLYYVRETKDAKKGKRVQLLSCAYSSSDKREKILLTQRGDVTFPKISPSGKRVLFYDRKCARRS